MWIGFIYQKFLNRLSLFRKIRFERTYKSHGGFGNIERHKAISRDIVKFIPKQKYKSALDFGCGYGFVAGKLAEKIKSVIGVDISESALTTAKKYNKHVEFIQHDVISYRRGIHDLIVCVGILPYIHERYVPGVASNIDAMLSPNGVLAVFEKVGYTGTKIDDYISHWNYKKKTKRVKVSGEDFIMIVLKKGAFSANNGSSVHS